MDANKGIKYTYSITKICLDYKGKIADIDINCFVFVLLDHMECYHLLSLCNVLDRSKSHTTV